MEVGMFFPFSVQYGELLIDGGGSKTQSTVRELKQFRITAIS